jgi:hypothetical protein
MSLEKTIKDLEALEESLKDGTDHLSEEQLQQLTSQLQEAFNTAVGAMTTLESESKIQLENLQNEK